MVIRNIATRGWRDTDTHTNTHTIHTEHTNKLTAIHHTHTYKHIYSHTHTTHKYNHTHTHSLHTHAHSRKKKFLVLNMQENSGKPLGRINRRRLGSRGARLSQVCYRHWHLKTVQMVQA